jgi:hypothetical protein
MRMMVDYWISQGFETAFYYPSSVGDAHHVRGLSETTSPLSNLDLSISQVLPPESQSFIILNNLITLELIGCDPKLDVDGLSDNGEENNFDGTDDSSDDHGEGIAVCISDLDRQSWVYSYHLLEEG